MILYLHVSYKNVMLLIKVHAGGKFSSLQKLKICLNYVSEYSVRKKYQIIQKIAEITMTVTKIDYTASFGIFGNISGSFGIQNRLNIGIYIVHTISNIFTLALQKKNATNL